MQSLDLKLREILNVLCDKCDLQGSNKGQGIFIDQSITAIKSCFADKVRGMETEVRRIEDWTLDMYNSKGYRDNENDVGYNQAISDILLLLEGGRGKK